MIKIIFFGSSIHSLPTLQALIKKGYTISAVVSPPDRPVGRKQIMTPTPVSEFANKHHIPTIKPLSQKEKPWLFADENALKNELNKFHPDLLVVCYFGQKIPQEILDLPKFGGLNIHPSLLPKYRGSAPAEWAIIRGEKETGVSIIKISEKFDEGMIVAQQKEIISENDTSEMLYERLFPKGAKLLTEVLPGFLYGKIKLLPQNKSQGSYFPRFQREDGFVPWKLIVKATNGEKLSREDFLEFPLSKFLNFELCTLNFALVVARASRALTPWPGLWTLIEINQSTNQPIDQLNGKRLKILKSHAEKNKLILEEIQLEGKNPVSGKDFLRN